MPNAPTAGMNKILCGTDFSQQAERAARAAAALARRFGDGIVLAHVLEPQTTNILELAEDVRIYEHGVRETIEKALEKAAAPLRSLGVEVETVPLSGHPHDALTARARELGARMIVVGSHGRHAPWRWFVGSAADRCVRSATLPTNQRQGA